MNDPTLYKYSFWIRWQVQDFGVSKKDNWKSINLVINQAWNWIHDQVGKSPPSIEVQPWENKSRIESKRIAGTNWLQQKKYSYLYDARALLDSIYLQMGVSIAGEEDEKIIPVLQNRLKNFYQAESAKVSAIKLGELTCFYAEVSKKDNITNIARSCMEKLFPTGCEEITTINFSWGSITIPSASSNFFIVLSNMVEAGISQASQFLNFVLPRLMLAFFKADLEYSDYESSLRKVAEQAERKLCRVLEGREKTGNLKYLENRTLELSRHQDELAENLAKVKQKLITIKTNVRNIEFILNDSTIQAEQKLLFERFGEPCRFAAEQMDLDLSYFQSRTEEATLALQTMRTFIDIERGKTDRNLVIVLSIVGGIIAIGDALSEIPFNYRVGMIIGVVLFSIFFLLFRILKRRFKGIYKIILSKKSQH